MFLKVVFLSLDIKYMEIDNFVTKIVSLAWFWFQIIINVKTDKKVKNVQHRYY